MLPKAARMTRARTLLRRLLSESQWDDFCKTNSFREIVNGKDGLPWQRVEFGIGFRGWIQFRTTNWEVPSYFRNVEIRDSNDFDWIIEDLIISMLLRVRMRPEEVLDPNWACKSSIMIGDPLCRQIMERTFHLANSE